MSKFSIIFLLLLLFFKTVGAQEREYTFGKPGNRCFFHFDVYAPNEDYALEKRPFIFILGKEGEVASTIYNRDTLKYQPQFYNYKFVYIPNLGDNTHDKLYCLESLTSLLTFHYYYGHENLFLIIDDSTISQADISSANLDKIFGSVRLYEKQDDSEGVESISILKDFEENSVEYANNQKSINEDYNTYYVEPEEETDEDLQGESEVSVKTYFGKPTTYDFTFSGIIKDKLTGEALPFATVMVKGTNNGATTNADGFFTLVKVPTDTNTLIVQYIGYNPEEIFLTPYIPKRNYTIEMKPSSQSLSGVTVTAKKEDVVIMSKNNEVSTYKMTPKKLEKLPSLGEKDVMRSLQLMPGISASNESSSGLYVRGGTPDQNLILYDGFTVYHVDHLYGFYSAFNSNAIKDIRLYKGGFESKFGGRISSVTEITGKDGNQNIFNMGADISLLSVNGFMEIPVGDKFTSLIAYRRSYKGLLYNSIFEKFNGTDEPEVTVETQGERSGMQSESTTVTNYFYDLNGKFTYRPNDKDIISLSIFNGTDKLDNSSSREASSFGSLGHAFGMNTTDLTKYGNIGGSLKWSRKWNDKLYGNTIISYSNYYSDRDRSRVRTTVDEDENSTSVSTGVFEDNDLKDYSLKSDYQLDLFKNAQFQFGVFGSWYDIDYTYSDNDTSILIDKDDETLLAGGYLQTRLSGINDKLSVIPGVRINYFEPTDQVYYEPRLSASYKINSLITIKAATGKFYQFVNKVTREDILSGSRDFWLLSDGNSIPVSSALHFDLGLSWDNMDYLFGIEAYYKKIDNLTEYSLRFNTSPMGVSYDENFFNGKGFSKGIEFLAQKNSGNLNGWISYTLGTAQNYFDIYSDEYYPANQDVTHEFKVVGLYKYKRWDFSATWIYATGRPYTAPSGAYTVTLLDGTEQDYFTVSAKNGLRLPAYHRLDISANYKIILGNKGDRKRRDIGYIGLSLFNVYNRENVWYKEYTIEDGEILETSINYLGITPNLTLSIKLR